MLRHARRLCRYAAVPVLAAAVISPATASASTCAGAGAAPAKLGEAGVRHATLCLLNQQRRAHGVRALKADGRLGRVALGHSKDMVLHHYFAHESRTGAPFSARMPSNGFHILGENIGWGSGSLATPRSMVNAWMHSPPHRQNILDARYRSVGVGVAFGAPVGGSGASYTTDFGG